MAVVVGEAPEAIVLLISLLISSQEGRVAGAAALRIVAVWAIPTIVTAITVAVLIGRARELPVVVAWDAHRFVGDSGASGTCGLGSYGCASQQNTRAAMAAPAAPITITARQSAGKDGDGRRWPMVVGSIMGARSGCGLLVSAVHRPSSGGRW